MFMTMTDDDDVAFLEILKFDTQVNGFTESKRKSFHRCKMFLSSFRAAHIRPLNLQTPYKHTHII